MRIEGHTLWGSIVQPFIIVGGHPLENVTFDPSGKAIEGTLPTELKIAASWSTTASPGTKARSSRPRG